MKEILFCCIEFLGLAFRYPQYIMKSSNSNQSVIQKNLLRFLAWRNLKIKETKKNKFLDPDKDYELPVDCVIVVVDQLPEEIILKIHAQKQYSSLWKGDWYETNEYY